MWSFNVWTRKKFAQSIATAMKNGYLKLEKEYPDLSKKELFRLTLSARPSHYAKVMLEMNGIWKMKGTFSSLVYVLVCGEWKGGSLGPIDFETQRIFLDTISNTLGDFSREIILDEKGN